MTKLTTMTKNNATRQGKPIGMCQWFLNCREKATTTVSHPILGNVPCCPSCAKKGS